MEHVLTAGDPAIETKGILILRGNTDLMKSGGDVTGSKIIETA